MPPFYYFRAPNFDISPDSPTAPRLGSILSSLRRLTSPLNQHDYITIPRDLLNNTDKSGFKDTVSKSLGGNIGFHAELTEPLAGVGSGELIYGFSKDSRIIYSCEKLATEEFEPNKEFVTQCVHASQAVQDYIQESFVGRKSVFMITGLKIATGFRVSSANSNEHGIKLGIKGGGASFGIPADGGPVGSLIVKRGRELEYGGGLKILFAYRAIRIRPKSDGEMKFKDISGGQYGIEDDLNDTEEEEWILENVDAKDGCEDKKESAAITVVHLEGNVA